MTYEIYRYIFIGGAVLCGVMTVTSILLFILLKIPKVISDLTGRTARIAIENIRNQNEATGTKTYKSSAVNRQRGRVTDKISPSGSLLKHPTEELVGAMATEKIGGDAENTTVLETGTAQETTVLGGTAQETTVLGGTTQETTVLDTGFAQDTTVLSNAADFNGVQTGAVSTEFTGLFEIEYEITYIHTNEVVTAEVH